MGEGRGKWAPQAPPLDPLLRQDSIFTQTQDRICHSPSAIVLDFAREFFGRFVRNQMTNWSWQSIRLVHTKSVLYLPELAAGPERLVFKSNASFLKDDAGIS